MSEFNLSKKRSEWVNKWIQKRLSGRAVIEMKEHDKEFIRLLKAQIFSPIFDSTIKTQDMIEEELNEAIDKLAGDDLK